MAKELTLPRGYLQWLTDPLRDPGDYLGDLAEVSGFNYLGSNIALSAVKNVLEEDNYSLASLCQSSEINVWAAFKPTATDQSHGMAPDGFNLEYQARTVFRLGDWIGYNHLAQPPWAMALTFNYTGNGFYGGIIIKFPEFSFKSIVPTAEKIKVEVYKGAVLNNTVYGEITDAVEDNMEISFENIFEIDGDSGNFTYTCKLYLCRDDNVVMLNFPKADLSPGPLEVTGYAYEIADPIMIVYLETFYHYVELRNDLNKTTGQLWLDFRLYDYEGGPGVDGTCDIYAFNPGDAWYKLNLVPVTLWSNATTEFSATLPGDFDLPLTQNLQVEIRNIVKL